MKYSIDTSAILDAWRRRYPPDVFPAVWVRLDEAIDAGDLGASEEVLLEVEKRDDEVHEWAKARKTDGRSLDESAGFFPRAEVAILNLGAASGRRSDPWYFPLWVRGRWRAESHT